MIYSSDRISSLHTYIDVANRRTVTKLHIRRYIDAGRKGYNSYYTVFYLNRIARYAFSFIGLHNYLYLNEDKNALG